VVPSMAPLHEHTHAHAHASAHGPNDQTRCQRHECCSSAASRGVRSCSPLAGLWRKYEQL
jgi:hypothetical protein